MQKKDIDDYSEGYSFTVCRERKEKSYCMYKAVVRPHNNTQKNIQFKQNF